MNQISRGGALAVLGGGLATEARLNHTVLVHPEPYQDDHRYIEYCFTLGGEIQDLGMLVQVQLLPSFAKPIGELACGFPETPVLIDHLGWPTRGTPAEYEEVLLLAKAPTAYMKVSGLIGDPTGWFGGPTAPT